MKKTIALILLTLSFLMILAGCSPQAQPDPEPSQTEEPAAYTKFAKNFFGTFDTLIVIQGYAQEQETFDTLSAEIEARFTRYHQVYDNYNAYEGVNNLYSVNANAGNGPTPAEPELIELLLYCREIEEQGAGVFNIALGSVLALWHIYRDAGEYDPSKAELPPMEKLQSAAQHTSLDDVVIDAEAGTIQFLDPNLRLDIGAVAKGYATEQVAQWLLTTEMPSFLISAGGNVRCGEKPLDGRMYWNIGIQDPGKTVLGNASENYLDSVYVTNESVVTSGDYQRFYVVDGKRYHHLIDPNTLMPGDYFRSVSVVAEDSGLADVLSTVFFLLPYDEGLALAESMEGVEVMWVLNDGENTVRMTDGMIAMSKEMGATSGGRLTAEQVAEAKQKLLAGEE